LVQRAPAIRWGDIEGAISGGVESMSRAPFVMAKPEEAFPRAVPAMYDTTLGWRFPNPRLAQRFPLESMGETAENVAERYGIRRSDQDLFALESHLKAASAWQQGVFADEVVAVKTRSPDSGTVSALL